MWRKICFEKARLSLYKQSRRFPVVCLDFAELGNFRCYCIFSGLGYLVVVVVVVVSPEILHDGVVPIESYQMIGGWRIQARFAYKGVFVWFVIGNHLVVFLLLRTRTFRRLSLHCLWTRKYFSALWYLNNM
jgi:hypothetical protein